MRKSREAESHALFDKHPRLSLAKLSRKYNIPYSTLWRHSRTYNPEPKLTAPVYTQKDIITGVITGTALGALVTIFVFLANGYAV